MPIEPDQTKLTGQQIAALRHMGMTNASAGDLQVFFDYAKTYGLDPFTEEITMVGRHGRQQLQTDVDGITHIARTAADTAGTELVIGTPEYENTLGWHNHWPVPEKNGEVPDTPPLAVAVNVIHDGITYEGIAAYTEYAATDTEGNLDPAWQDAPEQLLTNIATALALRQIFPEQLSIIFLTEELRQADRYDPGRKGNEYGTLRMAGAPGKKPSKK